VPGNPGATNQNPAYCTQYIAQNGGQPLNKYLDPATIGYVDLCNVRMGVEQMDVWTLRDQFSRDAATGVCAASGAPPDSITYYPQP
jgi:hypothetical protein